MTRDDFIKRLEEVGFINGNITYAREDMDHKWDNYEASESRGIGIIVCSNKDLFICGETAYTFDELEQFLIDKGIVEKEEPFDAHTYLIGRGFVFDEEYKEYRKDKNVYIEAWQTIKELRGLKVVYAKKIESCDKESCDKAIKLSRLFDRVGKQLT